VHVTEGYDWVFMVKKSSYQHGHILSDYGAAGIPPLVNAFLRTARTLLVSDGLRDFQQVVFLLLNGECFKQF
jgi:hypothetical protein